MHNKNVNGWSLATQFIFVVIFAMNLHKLISLRFVGRFHIKAGNMWRQFFWRKKSQDHKICIFLYLWTCFFFLTLSALDWKAFVVQPIIKVIHKTIQLYDWWNVRNYVFFLFIKMSTASLVTWSSFSSVSPIISLSKRSETW